MSNVRFTSTKLNGTGKRGILKPDANGYYEMVIGGLNAFNSAGEYYTLQGAQKLFEESSIFMRRVKNGCLKGEVGHPKKTPGMTNQDYVNRILTIDEKNVCCHFKEVWLDPEFGKRNPSMGNTGLTAIMALVKPAGPKGDSLQASLDNPDENVCFSIRAFTIDQYVRGVNNRMLDSIICFDHVAEPGIAIASKYSAPSLESLIDAGITEAQLLRLINQDNGLICTEDSKEIAIEALKMFATNSKPPVYTKW